jgi:hypothetical protein
MLHASDVSVPTTYRAKFMLVRTNCSHRFAVVCTLLGSHGNKKECRLILSEIDYVAGLKIKVN